MSVNNETYHQLHLDDRKFNSNCEDCWQEPVVVFAPNAKFKEPVDPIFQALLGFQTNHIAFLKLTKKYE